MALKKMPSKVKSKISYDKKIMLPRAKARMNKMGLNKGPKDPA